MGVVILIIADLRRLVDTADDRDWIGTACSAAGFASSPLSLVTTCETRRRYEFCTGPKPAKTLLLAHLWMIMHIVTSMT